MLDNQRGRSYPGIVFDLDGTLIESTIDFLLMRQRVLRYLRGFGIEENLLDDSETIAKNVLRVSDALLIRSDQDGSKKMFDEVERICNEVEVMRVDGTKEVPGARRVLLHLREHQYRVGILTRGSRTYAEKALHEAGLNGHFDALVCRDDHDVSEAKPHPVALYRTAEALGLSASQCISIGDHLMDLECARQAGSTFVAVLSGSYGRERWEAYGVCYIIPSVSNFPELLERIGS